jgi:hypothetical protein
MLRSSVQQMTVTHKHNTNYHYERSMYSILSFKHRAAVLPNHSSSLCSLSSSSSSSSSSLDPAPPLTVIMSFKLIISILSVQTRKSSKRRNIPMYEWSHYASHICQLVLEIGSKDFFIGKPKYARQRSICNRSVGRRCR